MPQMSMNVSEPSTPRNPHHDKSNGESELQEYQFETNSIYKNNPTRIKRIYARWDSKIHIPWSWINKASYIAVLRLSILS